MGLGNGKTAQKVVEVGFVEEFIRYIPIIFLGFERLNLSVGGWNRLKCRWWVFFRKFTIRIAKHPCVRFLRGVHPRY